MDPARHARSDHDLLQDEEDTVLDISDDMQIRAPPGAMASRALPVSLDGLDDDPAMPDFVAARLREPPPPTWFHLDATGVQPLEDDWEVQVVAATDALLVVELPVLVAQSRAQFVDAHPAGLRVEADIAFGTERIVQDQSVTHRSLATDGPTWLFFKVVVPRKGSSTIAFRIRTAEDLEPPVNRYSRSRLLVAGDGPRTALDP